jgi:hypothetical protein
MVKHARESRLPFEAQPTAGTKRPRPDDQRPSARDGRPGRLERIWLKRFTGGPMDPVDAAALDAMVGLVGNANRSRRRQVTIIARERWNELMRDLGARLPPSTRRANLMVSGIDLQNSRGGSCASAARVCRSTARRSRASRWKPRTRACRR